ncbi:MAG: NADPH-dependent assimilatory sulfite reductase hemoprotein subunit [Pseudobdellovibrionaceae bacterium]
MSKNKLSKVEEIKVNSRQLRGTLKESLENQITGALFAQDENLIKFHGMYQQDDRDRRQEREDKKLERAYSYMIRLRLPAGDLSADQWLKIQDLSEKNGTGIIKITTRETIQLHGVVKSVLKPTVNYFGKTMGLDSIAACGDVNRNVMCTVHPFTDQYPEVHAFAKKISEHLLPKTRAFHEIWLDEEPLHDSGSEKDPLYESRYLPRKFKIAIAIPPYNDVDLFANDIGLIAIIENQKFTGFNISVGGGMGTTHDNPNTYARMGSVIGFIPKDKTLDAAWQVLAIQRDFGNREDRKLSRLKYTIDRMGLDVFKKELEQRLGFSLQPVKPYKFTAREEQAGWMQSPDGFWHYTVFVENGRVRDLEQYSVKAFLKAVAETGSAQFRFTGHQNVMLTQISAAAKKQIEDLIQLHLKKPFSDLHTHAMACVALNTCSLALAEAQRYLPSLLEKIDGLRAKHNITRTITVRMTGCPNGCARPYLAEIGLVGKAYGRYALRLGGDHLGERLNQVSHAELDEEGILSTLDGLFLKYKPCADKETFGDFIHRQKLF